MTSSDVEFALVSTGFARFHYRRYLVVPNPSWGVGLHECDLLAITESGYAHEVEIKVSKHDLIRDAEKRHNHYSPRIKYLWFAGPEELETDFLEHVPEDAGILLVKTTHSGLLVPRELRRARARKGVGPWPDADRYKLARLGTTRYWTRFRPGIRDRVEGA